MTNCCGYQRLNFAFRLDSTSMAMPKAKLSELRRSGTFFPSCYGTCTWPAAQLAQYICRNLKYSLYSIVLSSFSCALLDYAHQCKTPLYSVGGRALLKSKYTLRLGQGRTKERYLLFACLGRTFFQARSISSGSTSRQAITAKLRILLSDLECNDSHHV